MPLHSAEHFYVVTDQLEGVHPDLPILRDPDGYIYVKEEVGGLVVGGFEPVAKPWVAPSEIPYPFEFQLLDEDWEHFSVLMDAALERIPALEQTGIRKFYNGPESFTPDNQFLLGEAPGLAGYFVGAGFNSVGIASAGGAGRALAEWIVEGEPSMDLTASTYAGSRRTPPTRPWLRSRVAEILGLHYAVPVAQPRAGDRPRRAALAAARADRRRRGDVRHPQRAGSGRSTSARRSTTAGPSRRGSSTAPPSRSPAGPPWRSSTRRRSASTPSADPDALAHAAVGVRQRRRRRRSATPSTRRGSTRAAPTSRTSR